MIYARVKHLVFQYYGIAALLTVLVAAVWFFQGQKGKDEITVFITILGGVASALYFIQKQKLEELRLFKELFVNFNSRYDGFNESLNRMSSGEQSS